MEIEDYIPTLCCSECYNDKNSKVVLGVQDPALIDETTFLKEIKYWGMHKSEATKGFFCCGS